MEGTFVRVPRGSRGGVKVLHLIQSYFEAFSVEVLLTQFYTERPNFWHVAIKYDVIEGANSKNEPPQNFI